jgi:HAD superfamily hydrolase (TIGR01484 family)
MIPHLVAFDIDGTLTESKQPISPAVADVFTKLLAKTKVALTSGGMKELAQKQIIAHLAPGTTLQNLYLLPTSGTALLIYRGGGWETVYEERLTVEEVARITAVLEDAAHATGVIDFSSDSYGERIENRGSQVSLSALGQQAPVALKEAWDPTREKREKMLAVITPLLPEFEVKLGGLTTFDVTKKGINKAYGIRKLSDYLGIPIGQMLYIGDALFPGGNDEVVKETGIKTMQTSGPKETVDIITKLIY